MLFLLESQYILVPPLLFPFPSNPTGPHQHGVSLNVLTHYTFHPDIFYPRNIWVFPFSCIQMTAQLSASHEVPFAADALPEVLMSMASASGAAMSSATDMDAAMER